MPGRDRSARYSELRSRPDFDDDLAFAVSIYLGNWASSKEAAGAVGLPDTDDLDALFLMAAWADQTPLVLFGQVQQCLREGRSWAEVAAALGVSRQAAVKRFADGYYQRDREGQGE